MKKKFVEQYKENKKYFFFLVFHVLFAGFTFGIMNRPFGQPVVLKIPFDDMIPLIKEFIFIYHLFMPLIFIIGVILFTYDLETAKLYVLSLFLSQIIAYVIFFVFQTDVPRADVATLGNDLASRLIKFTYSVDNHYSGFPSLHMANMTSLIFILIKSNLPRKITSPISILAFFIAISTVLVKQHVFLDLPAGLIHGIYSIYLGEWAIDKFENKREDEEINPLI